MEITNELKGAVTGAKAWTMGIDAVTTALRVAVLALAAFAALATQGAWAAGTAGDLLRECLKPTRVEDTETLARTGKATGLCRGYLSRIVGMLSAGGSGGMAARHGICPPPEAPDDDALVSIFVEYAQGNPGQLEERQLAAVLAAYHHAWPCPKAAPPQAESVSTLEQLAGPAATPAVTPEPAPGAASPPVPDWTVSKVQIRLKALGYDPGPSDGVIGPLTAAAVRNFQRDHGLTPDGQLSESLIQTIQKAGGE